MSHRWLATASRLLLLSAALAAGVCLAAEPSAPLVTPRGRYLFRSYGTEQGLRNLAVYTLEQDVQGFIWAGSEDGLYRYDGQRFERFGAEHGLPGADIKLLHRAGDGRLWVGTGEGLAVQEGPHFRTIGTADGLPPGETEGLTSQRDGTLYAVIDERLYVGGATQRFEPVLTPPLRPVGRMQALDPEDPDKPKRPRVTGVWVEPEGRELVVAWMTPWGAVLTRRNVEGAWTQEQLSGQEQEYAERLLRDRRGRLWLRGRHTLWMQERPGAPIRDLSGQLPGSASIHVNLFLDAQDRLWVPTLMGLAVIRDERVELLGETEGLPTHWAEAVLMDREGSLWVASEGLHRVQGRLAWSVHSRRNGLPADTVWNILRDRQGRLWAGTARGLAEGTAGGWQPVLPTAGRPIYTVVEDGEGGVWAAGTHLGRTHGTLFYLPPGARAWQQVPGLPLPGRTAVGTLEWDPRRRVLLLGTLYRGLYQLRLTPEGSKLERVELPDGTETESIQDIHVDRRGHVWVAGERGLARFDGQHWRRYGVAHGLIDSNVGGIAEAPSGELLVTYYDSHGLSRFLPDRGRAVPMEGPAELVADSIYSVGFDPRGVLWLGTATGIKRWDGGRVERFGQGSGVPGEDCSFGALWFDLNGDVWMGMSSGLAHFHAGVEQPPPAPPQTVITAVVHSNGAPRPPPTEPLQLPYEKRSLEFHVAALGFLNEARVVLQVRLVEFEDWRDSPVRQVRYTHLPPGSYRFEARARISDGPWGDVASLAFQVAAPWWQTWWGLALMGVAAGALLAQLFRWRLSYLRRENERLEALVRARTRELEEASLLDPLTGAKNRRFLQLTLPNEVARVLRRWRNAPPGSPPESADIIFLMVDLDHFKSVNDTYGHSVGDRVLCQASAVLRAALRETDTLVRWGGEEFLVVAQQSSRDAAESIAAKLRDAIRTHEFDLGEGQRLRRTCSIGFAAFPFLPGTPEALSWEDVVELSDRCLYAAKNSGRDGWVGLVCRRPIPVPEGRLHVSDVLPGMVESRALELVSSFPSERKLVWR